MPDKHVTCEWALDRIEAYIDDDLGGPERARFAQHVAVCESCARELAFAGRVREELRSLPSFAAPAEPLEAAARAALDGDSAPPPSVIALPVRRRVAWRWMAAAAAAMVVIVSAVWFGVGERARGRHEELARAGVTEAEVEAARIEVEIAFGYVGKYSDRAARIVRDDVMEARVVPRVERAVRQAGFDVTPRGRGRS